MSTCITATACSSLLRRPSGADDQPARERPHAVSRHRLAGGERDGEAVGTSVNVALPAGTGRRRLAAGLRRGGAAAAARRSNRNVLLTQHGCDTHALDPLAHLRCSVDGQRLAYSMLHALAHEVCDGRWVAVGGGGYELLQVVPRAWTHLLAEVTGEPVGRRDARAMAGVRREPDRHLAWPAHCSPHRCPTGSTPSFTPWAQAGSTGDRARPRHRGDPRRRLPGPRTGAVSTAVASGSTSARRSRRPPAAQPHLRRRAHPAAEQPAQRPVVRPGRSRLSLRARVRAADWSYEEIVALLAERVGIVTRPRPRRRQPTRSIPGAVSSDSTAMAERLARRGRASRAGAGRHRSSHRGAGDAPRHRRRAERRRLRRPDAGGRLAYLSRGRRRYLLPHGGVAMVTGGADLEHTHDPEPMRGMLARSQRRPAATRPGDRRPRLRRGGRHGGASVVGFADCNDPALFVGEAEGRIAVAVPLDDNVLPHLYAPLTDVLLAGIGAAARGPEPRPSASARVAGRTAPGSPYGCAAGVRHFVQFQLQTGITWARSSRSDASGWRRRSTASC